MDHIWIKYDHMLNIYIYNYIYIYNHMHKNMVAFWTLRMWHFMAIFKRENDDKP